MVKTVRSRRITIAAGALSLALVAPFVTPADVAPVAAAVDASAFNSRYNTTNFWNANEAVVQGLTLEPGDTVAATTNTIFNWKFRTSGCNLIIGRPQSSTGFRTGNQDIPVKVIKADGSSFNTKLRVNVVDTKDDSNSFTEPSDNCPTPTPTTTTSATEPTSAEESSTSEAPKTTASTLNGRYNTTNIWNEQEAQIEGLQLQPGDGVSATTNTIFNWRFRNDDGTLTVIRPQSPAAFNSGEVDIPVRVTTPQGDSFTTTLRLNVIDEQPPVTYEIPPVETRETVDFEQGRSAVVDAWDVPEGVTVEKQVGFQAIGVVGWDVEVQNGKIVVKAPGTFSSGDDVDIPVTFSDGTSTADRTLRIRALNPQTTGEDIAGTVGTIVGNIIGGATGSGSVGDLVGGLIGGGSGEGGRGGLLEGLVKVEVQPSAVIVTGNANPTVEIRDNGSNNGSGNSVVITDNANPRDNLNNNSVEASAIVTGNANPVITGNANPVITGNANPVITGNLNDNGSNNSAVVTGNANPVVTGNANNNGSGNSVVVTNNANPSDIGSNNSVVVTGNANPTVDIRDNASNNDVQVTGNANPVVTGNANGGLFGSSGGSSNKDQGGTKDPALVNANVDTAGGSSDPRCIAPLVGLGLPLIALVPLALAQQVKVPGLDDLSRQASRAFDDAVRNTGFDATQVTAVGGGVVGVVAALLLTAAVRTCIPQVRGVDVNINGSSNKSEATKAAPVVDTPTA